MTHGKRSVLLATAPVLLVVLTVAWVGVWVLTRRPGLVVKDSPKFVDVLTIWHPLVFARSSTPRSVKRFMNRVRYLAMRQRRQTESPPAWRRLLRRPLPPAEPGDAAGAEGAHNNSAIPIPDELLVALAAIQHFRPRWLTNGEALLTQPSKKEPTDFVLAIVESNKYDWELLQEAKAAHLIKFEVWGDEKLVAARDEFLRISEGVQVN